MILTELRDALAKATGPDFNLNIQIGRMLGWTLLREQDVNPSVPGVSLPQGCPPNENHMTWLPRYTASIDAAVTLENVPDIEEIVVRKYSTGFYVRWTWLKPHTRYAVVYGNAPDGLAKTEALGRCLARVEYELAKEAQAVTARGEAR